MPTDWEPWPGKRKAALASLTIVNDWGGWRFKGVRTCNGDLGPVMSRE